ncbi:radical SAM/SPASM domain-containing protein [Anaerocolumna xylanovorans]|uniref:Radical SAM additional 4Fe4S-binding SPASM domain-containing protein n=1 Tax=Anaerocolumna xylanovorans DSM 12503 TaxID=1121345 RepID=A0A1M7Y4W5_9FIRM|nr:radical SAM protein [Anaerocolumna xylanovorans]SHO47422.1 radical SAM additional 4Fe4S-binding SPASM domain-containing protein [Anaerocolumna xylanovorans DSM 12503]
MEFEYKNKLIQLNDFTRDYKVINKENRHLLKQSINTIEINDINSYIEYAKKINSFNNVYYNITKRCNLKCSYCYSEHNESYVSLDQNKIILNKLGELNTKTITLIGGEPFCHPYFYDLLESIKKKESISEICIVTNGTLIDNKRIEAFKDKRIFMQISLDGINEETNALTRGIGTFEKVANNFAILKENKIKFKIMKVITRENIDFSQEFYSYYKKHGIETGFFMVKQVPENLKPTNEQIVSLLDYIYINEDKNIDRVFDIVKFADNMMFDKNGFPITHCGAGINALSVNPNGDTFPCVKKSQHDDLITNIFNEEAIEKIKINRLHILEKELVMQKEFCNNCTIKFFCGGGCRAEESNKIPCEYNCTYFKLALEYFCKKVCEGIV